MALTDNRIKHAKPRDKDYKIADEKGLYVLVKTNGVKYFRFKYRMDGKEKLLALGVYGDVTLADAREARDQARTQIKKGIDPIANKHALQRVRQDAKENSFEVIANEWLIKRGKKASDTRLMGLLQKHLLPRLGTRPIKEITPRELLEVLEHIEENSIDMAHRAKQYAGQIFQFAIASARAEYDPSANLKRALKSRNVKHFAAITEPKEVGILMTAIKNYWGTPVVNAALELTALLFLRQNELCKLEWSEVKWDEQCIKLPGEKMKMREDHIVPLSTQALNILTKLRMLTGYGKYVFPSARGMSRAMSTDTVRCALRTLGYEKNIMTAHGFRAMARTLLDEVLDYPIEWIEQQLAHEVKDTNGRAYNRTKHLERRRGMMQRYANYLDELRLGSSNIVSIESVSHQPHQKMI